MKILKKNLFSVDFFANDLQVSDFWLFISVLNLLLLFDNFKSYF